MITAEEFDIVADAVTGSYRAMLLGMIGVFAKALENPFPDYPAAKSELSLLLFTPQNGFWGSYNRSIPDEEGKLVKAAEDAMGRVLTPSEGEIVKTLIGEMNRDLHGFIYAVMVADETSVMKVMSRFGFEVHGKIASGGSRVMALLTSRREKVESVKFEQMDRGQKRWKSEVLVRTAVRMHLVSVYIETCLFLIQASGGDVAAVSHPEADHKFNGLVFSITGETPNMPSYMEIKDQVWHPNSRALVVRV